MRLVPAILGLQTQNKNSDLLTAVSDKTAKAFNRFVAAQDVKFLYIQGFLQGLAHWYSSPTKSYGTSGQLFGLILLYLDNRQLQVVLILCKNIPLTYFMPLVPFCTL